MTKYIFLVFALLMGGAVHAESPKAPDEVVKEGTATLQGLIAQNHAKYKADLPGFYKTVDDIVVSYFDVPFIARTVLARNYREATDAQRKRFQDAFKSMLIHSYANSLLEYHDSVEAEWKPLRMAPTDTDVVVNSALIRGEGKPPIAIGFAMHLVNNKWKVYDITIENLSLVTNFRSQFAAEIKKNGLDAVITRMEGGKLKPAEPAVKSKG